MRHQFLRQTTQMAGAGAGEGALLRLLSRGMRERVWRLLDDAAGCAVRVAHPTLAAVVAELPWHWLSESVKVRGTVVCMRRFASAWPRAACRVSVTLMAGWTDTVDMWRALPPHVTQLELLDGGGTGALVEILPVRARALSFCCWTLTEAVSFGRFPALETLNCWRTAVGDAVLATLPPTLRNLNVSYCRRITTAASFARLPVLAKLVCEGTAVGNAAVVALPAKRVGARAERLLQRNGCRIV